MIKRLKKLTDGIFVRYTIFFLFSVLIIFFPFLSHHKTLISYADGFNQFLPVYIYTGRYLRHLPEAIYRTHQIPQFDFSIGFGEDIIGTLNCYGFGSVFNILSAFFSSKSAYIGYSMTILLKLYLGGVSFALFARNKKKRESSILIGMILYAFQGYALYYSTIFYSFGDVLTFLPLCLLGTDLIIDRKKQTKGMLVFSFSVCCTALSGFYFLYMVSVAIAFYFVYVTIREKRFADMTENLVRGAAAYIVGLCMSGIVLLPAIYSFFHSSRTNSNGTTIVQYLLSLPGWNEIRKQWIALFLPQYEDGLGIPIVCIVLLIWALFVKRRKSVLGVLLLIFFSFIPLVGSAMNGFSYSTNRWEFVIYFAVAWEMVAVLDSCQCWRKPIALLCLANVLLYGLLFNIKWVVNFRAPQSTYQEIESSALAQFTFLNQNLENAESLERLDIHDTSLGGSLVLNSDATTSYFSISNGYLYEFFESALNSTGIGGSTFCLRGLDGRQSLESLLSVRYYSRDDNGTDTIENKFRLPFGTVFTEVISEEQASNLHPLTISAMLSHQLILNRENAEIVNSESLPYDSFKSEKVTIQTDGIDYQNDMLHAEEGGRIIIVPDAACSADREYYIYIRGLKFEEKINEAKINVCGKSIILKGIGNRAYIGDLSDYLIKMEGDAPYSLQFEQAGSYSLDSVELLSIDMTNYPTEYQKLVNNGHLDHVTMDSNLISGTVDAESDGYLFLSIPYSEGWECRMDDTPIELIRTDYAFMSVPVTEGEHQIVLEYHSPWMRTGGCLSILGWIMWTVLWVKNRSSRHLDRE